MTEHAPLATLILLAGIGLPQTAGATSCELLTDFNPQSTTVVVDGRGFVAGSGVFRSPENTDPDLVWHIGDPATLDGCVGGVAPGSGAPTGQLEWRISDRLCMGVDVETTTPYTAELFDPGGVLVSSVTGSAPSYDLLFPPAGGTFAGYRLVLTPGTFPGGGRDALCVDNLRAVLVGTPVRARTWGTIKTIYR